MTKTFVAVTDSAQAKLFVLDDSEEPGRLAPLVELENSDRRIRPSEQFSDPRPGLRQAHPGGGRHGVDDGRDAHLHEHDRKFAAEIVATLRRHHRAEGLEALVITAPPSFLGVMRPALSPLERQQVSIHLSGKDLTGMGSAAIHDHLATQGLLPARGRIS